MMIFFPLAKYLVLSLMFVAFSCFCVQAAGSVDQGVMQPVPMHLENKPQGKLCWKAYTAFVDAEQATFDDRGREYNALKVLLSRKGPVQCTQVLFAQIAKPKTPEEQDINWLAERYQRTFVAKLKAAAEQGDIDAQKQYIKVHVRKIKGFTNQEEAREAALEWMITNPEVADRLCKIIARSAGELGIWPKNVRDFLAPVKDALLAKAAAGDDNEKIRALYNLLRLAKGEKIANQQAGITKDFSVRGAIEHALLEDIADQSNALQVEFLRGVFDPSYKKQSFYIDLWGMSANVLTAALPYLERFALAGNEQAKQLVAQYASLDQRIQKISAKLAAQAARLDTQEAQTVREQMRKRWERGTPVVQSDADADVNTDAAPQSDDFDGYEMVDAQQADNN